jgi:hypothetical protein
MTVPPPMVPHQYYNYMVHNHCVKHGMFPQNQHNVQLLSSPGGDQQGQQGSLDPTTALSNAAILDGVKVYSESGSGSGQGAEIGGTKDPLKNVLNGRGNSSSISPGGTVQPGMMPVGFRVLKDSTTTHMICSVCCKKDGRLCTGCGHIAYCGAKCQKIDWARHKYAECLPQIVVDKDLAFKMMTARSEEQGRGGGDGDRTLTAADEDRTLTDEDEDEDDVTPDVYTGKFIARRFITKGSYLHSAFAVMMACNDKGNK